MVEKNNSLPQFFIVGAPKAGTTALAKYLSAHPKIFMSEPKELNFFSREEIKGDDLYYPEFSIKNLVDYKSVFRKATKDQISGEASVSYLFYKDTPKKIKTIVPHAKIIILLRNPVYRAYSHYLMDRRMGLIDFEFREVVFPSKKNREVVHKYFKQYVHVGLYHDQVKRYLDLFGPTNVFIALSEELEHSRKEVLLSIFEFLEVPGMPSGHVQKNYNSGIEAKNGLVRFIHSQQFIRQAIGGICPESLKGFLKRQFFRPISGGTLDAQTAAEVFKLFSDDLTVLAGLINKNIDSWFVDSWKK